MSDQRESNMRGWVELLENFLDAYGVQWAREVAGVDVRFDLIAERKDASERYNIVVFESIQDCAKLKETWQNYQRNVVAEIQDRVSVERMWEVYIIFVLEKEPDFENREEQITINRIRNNTQLCRKIIVRASQLYDREQMMRCLAPVLPLDDRNLGELEDSSEVLKAKLEEKLAGRERASELVGLILAARKDSAFESIAQVVAEEEVSGDKEEK